MIDANKKGFLVVVDSSRVLGTLTDGDVRRAFLKGTLVDDGIDCICTKNSKCLNQTDDVPVTAEVFKNETIKFLPFIDEQGKLINIITKSQMHALLLQNIHADLEYDFMSWANK